MNVRSTVVVSLLGLAFLFFASNATPVSAARTVDLIDVETCYTGNSPNCYNEPGEPGQTIKAWIQYQVNSIKTVRIEIYDPDTDSVVMSWQGYRSIGTYLWFPQWTFKSTADSYEVLAFWWSGSSWIMSDWAVGWIQADKLIQNVGGWSPNQYTHTEAIPSGSDWVSHTFRFWWWDNTYYSEDDGTDRLQLLRDRTDWYGGAFKMDMLRDHEGWDAAYPVQHGQVTLCVIYDWTSNMPGAQADAEEYDCNDDDEEAEVWADDPAIENDFEVKSGRDPTDIHLTEGYYFRYKFYRKPAYRGQPILLDLEFELRQSWFDIPPLGDGWDIERATRQHENV